MASGFIMTRLTATVMDVHGSRGSSAVAKQWDQLFRLAAHEPRRQLVISLMDHAEGEWVLLPEAALSEHFDGTRAALEIELRHQHLPLMATHNIVHWRDEPLEATRGPDFEEMASLLRTLQKSADLLPPRLVDGCRLLEDGR